MWSTVCSCRTSFIWIREETGTKGLQTVQTLSFPWELQSKANMREEFIFSLDHSVWFWLGRCCPVVLWGQFMCFGVFSYILGLGVTSLTVKFVHLPFHWKPPHWFCIISCGAAFDDTSLMTWDLIISINNYRNWLKGTSFIFQTQSQEKKRKIKSNHISTEHQKPMGTVYVQRAAWYSGRALQR